MGPNGSGKSTLSYVLAGKEDYEVIDGEVLLDGENLLEMEPDERAAAGVFLAFQYPLEIPGVATMTFLKAALNAQRKARGEAELSTPDFIKRVNAARPTSSRSPKDMLKRAAQCRLLRRREEAHGNPADGAASSRSFCILDETDSGLDIDALRDRRRRRQRAALAGARASSSSPTTSACSNYIVPDTRARDGERPHRAVGRQGAGARARGERLRRLRRDEAA